MRRWTIWVLGGLAGLVVVYLAAAYLSGGVAKRNFEAMAGHPMWDAYQMELAIVEFDRGLFSSTATFRLTIPKFYETLIEDVDPNALPETIQFSYVIDHGPVIVSSKPITIGAARLEGHYDAPFGDMFPDWSGDKGEDLGPLAQMPVRAAARLDIAFDGSMTFSAESSAISASGVGKDDLDFEIGALSVNGETGSDMFNGTGRMSFDGANVRKEEEFIRVLPMTATGEFEMLEPHVWLGNWQGNMGGIVVNAEHSDMRTGELTLNSRIVQQEEAGLLQQIATMNLATVEQSFPFRVTFGPVRFELGLHDIAVEAFRMYNRMNSAILGMSADEAVTRPAWSDADIERLFKALSRPGPDIKLGDLFIGTDQGAITGTFSIGLKPGDHYSLDDRAGVAKGLIGEGRLQIPRPVLVNPFVTHLQNDAAAEGRELSEQAASERVNGQIEQAVQKGMLTTIGDDLGIEYEIDEGVLTVNGQLKIDLSQAAGQQ